MTSFNRIITQVYVNIMMSLAFFHHDRTQLQSFLRTIFTGKSYHESGSEFAPLMKFTPSGESPINAPDGRYCFLTLLKAHKSEFGYNERG